MLLKAAICDDEPQQAGMLEKYEMCIRDRSVYAEG